MIYYLFFLPGLTRICGEEIDFAGLCVEESYSISIKNRRRVVTFDVILK